MIYISSSAFTQEKITDTVLECIKLGILNIELSGGTKPYQEITNDLINLQKRYGINFLIHNYFPPLEEYPDFVMNVAAKEENERKNTFKIIKNAVSLSKSLSSDLYTIHPGFNISLYEKEGVFYKRSNSMQDSSTKEDFYKGIDFLLSQHAKEGFKIGIENFFPFEGQFHSFIQSQDDIIEFLDYYRDNPNIGLLLDLGHLNVAANFFGFDKYNFIDKLFSNYPDKIFEIHMSENMGVYDSHNISDIDSWQIEMAAKNKFLHDRPIVFEWRRCPFSLICERFVTLKRYIESQFFQYREKYQVL